MKGRLLLCLLVWTGSLRATPPPEAGPVLAFGAAEESWAPLFKQLAVSRTIFSNFTEQRWFGFKKTPVTLEGEMRLDPTHGLSLRYTQPDDRVMVIDDRGVLLRDARGRTRELPSDSRSGGLERVLLPALRFNLDEIRTYFVIHAARDDQDWRLDLEPKEAQLKKTLGNLLIVGTARRVQRLEFRRTDKQRVVILIRDTEENVTFSPEDLRRYFR